MIQEMQNKIKNTVKESRNMTTKTSLEDNKLKDIVSNASEVRQSLLLNKLVTQHKIKESYDKREYRIVTGSDDGYLFFWNIPHDFVTEAKNYFTSQTSNPLSARVKQAYKVPEIKPKHEVLLSGYA